MTLRCKNRKDDGAPLQGGASLERRPAAERGEKKSLAADIAHAGGTYLFIDESGII